MFEMYKNVPLNRPVNWHKFHPMANYFITLGTKKHLGLELVTSYKISKFFRIFERTAYIYKRKASFKGPIWIR
jgi:hypothetical protein